MSHDTTIQRLAHHPLLARCTRGELRIIARSGDIVRVEPGSVVSSPSHRPNPLVLLLDGEVFGCRSDELRGAAEVLAGVDRQDEVFAMTDATVVLLDPRRLVPLIEDCPLFALALMRRLAREGCAA